MLALIVIIVLSMVSMDTTVAKNVSFECNAEALNYYSRLRKCSSHRWSDPNDVKLMPTCCMTYEFACLKKTLFPKRCTVSSPAFDDHINRLYDYAESQCLSTDGSLTEETAKQRCMSASTAAVTDDECKKYLPCNDFNKITPTTTTPKSSKKRAEVSEHNTGANNGSAGNDTEIDDDYNTEITLNASTTTDVSANGTGNGTNVPALAVNPRRKSSQNSSSTALLIVIVILIIVLIISIFVVLLMQNRKRKAKAKLAKKSSSGSSGTPSTKTKGSQELHMVSKRSKL